MQTCTFRGLTKHGRLAFNAGVTYGFEDPDAVPYFVAMVWANEGAPSDAPSIIIPLDELDIDPLTIFGDGPKKGQYVMPERAEAALAAAKEA